MVNDTANLAKQTQPQSMRPFFIVWTGQAFSLLGSHLVQFALVWWLTQTSGSATVLALASMMAELPRVFLSPFAGADFTYTSIEKGRESAPGQITVKELITIYEIMGIR